MVNETAHCAGGLTMNICLSYGSRGEFVHVCQSIAKDVERKRLRHEDIQESTISDRMLTRHCPDPDIVIRTSGEYRISNFLLWQLAYSEFFFLSKPWPAIEKADLVQIIRDFANGRKRRYGK